MNASRLLKIISLSKNFESFAFTIIIKKQKQKYNLRR
ncbi:hypothetical protein M2347_004055 [Chryseobacterium sp. H1D6B]|nr:hypothetical protein [Chryseobacterium sp. H1D6B]